MFVEIQGESIPIEEEEISFWIGEFIVSWKCQKTLRQRFKGETFRMPTNPKLVKENFTRINEDRFGSSYQVPFSVLTFKHVHHTVFTLRHKVTKIIEWKPE
jgi:hypothetical protein